MQELLDKCCGIDVHKESLTAVRPDKPHTFRRKKKPSEERISNFIARIAAQEETNELEPIDKTS